MWRSSAWPRDGNVDRRGADRRSAVARGCVAGGSTRPLSAPRATDIRTSPKPSIAMSAIDRLVGRGCARRWPAREPCRRTDRARAARRRALPARARDVCRGAARPGAANTTSNPSSGGPSPAGASSSRCAHSAASRRSSSSRSAVLTAMATACRRRPADDPREPVEVAACNSASGVSDASRPQRATLDPQWRSPGGAR